MTKAAAPLLVAGALTGCAGGQHTTPTFSKDVAPILFEHCVPCHRPGQHAVPFPLIRFEDVAPRVEKIARATRNRHMPPWLPEPADPAFIGERRLSDGQIDTIQRWVSAGAPEGNRADLAQPPVVADDWQLGKPDLILSLPKPYLLGPALSEPPLTRVEGHDVFRNVVFRLSLPAQRFVRAVEFRPGDAPVHHAIIRVDRNGTSRARDGADGQPGFDGMAALDVQNPEGHFIGWAPGRGPIVAPDGMPWRLDPGSDLVVELHLLPGKQPVQVQPVIGLFFAGTPPSRMPVMVVMGSKAIDIPAGARDYSITDTYRLPVDVEVLSVYPHAHYLGKDMRVTAGLPDGRTRTLLQIRRWDFHWQQDYRYVTPVALPRGTTISMRYIYDNSDDNEDNPHHPPVAVTWGPQSSDEMGNLGLQLLPESAADAAVLVKEFAAKEAQANVASGEMLVQHYPESAPHQTSLGSSYLEVGRIPEAIAALEKAVRLDPKSAQAHNFLGGALLAAGRPQEALSHLRRASALAPEDAHLHFNLGKGFSAARQPADAAREFRAAIRLFPEFSEAHDELGVLLFSRNRLTEALASFQRAVDLAPDSAIAHSDLGGALAQAGRTEEALQHVRRALELDPNHGPALENLARLESRR